MNIAEFSYSKDGIKQLFKQSLPKIIVLYVFLILISLIVISNVFNAKNSEQNWQLIQYSIPTILLLFSFSGYMAYNRIKNQFSSFVLLITDTEIIREQKNMAIIRHLKSDITEIIKHKNGSFLIKANSVKDVIIVPSKIDNVDQLEGLLNQIMPIKAYVPRTFMERFPNPILLLFFVLLGAFFYV